MKVIVRHALLLHLDKNNSITPALHGFLTTHSTSSQLLQCVNDWTHAAGQGNSTDVCCIDFSHAFDNVSLPKFVQNFVAYGISGNWIEWLKAFLKNRTMRTKINHVYSDNITLLGCGPQGSVLGPLCFVIFMLHD